MPAEITRPPRRPAPGPKSTTWSADSIVSASCSTTMTLLPRSRRRRSVAMRRRLSRWCRPIDGSSSTYMTPESSEPSCDASRIRCASPPDSVAAARSSVRYSRPTSSRKPSRAFTSFKISVAIWARAPFKPQLAEVLRRARDGHRRDVDQALLGQDDGARLGPQALAVAGAAQLIAEVLAVPLARHLGRRLLHALLDGVDHAREAHGPRAGAVLAVPAHLDPLLAGPEQHDLRAGAG